MRHFNWFIWFLWFILFVSLNQNNQMNQTNQINPIDQPNRVLTDVGKTRFTQTTPLTYFR